jgi:hypothetical protein
VDITPNNQGCRPSDSKKLPYLYRLGIFGDNLEKSVKKQIGHCYIVKDVIKANMEILLHTKRSNRNCVFEFISNQKDFNNKNWSETIANRQRELKEDNKVKKKRFLQPIKEREDRIKDPRTLGEDLEIVTHQQIRDRKNRLVDNMFMQHKLYSYYYYLRIYPVFCLCLPLWFYCKSGEIDMTGGHDYAYTAGQDRTNRMHFEGDIPFADPVLEFVADHFCIGKPGFWLFRNGTFQQQMRTFKRSPNKTYILDNKYLCIKSKYAGTVARDIANSPTMFFFMDKNIWHPTKEDQENLKRYFCAIHTPPPWAPIPRIRPNTKPRQSRELPSIDMSIYEDVEESSDELL